MPPKGRALTPEKLEAIIEYISKFTSGKIDLRMLIVEGKKNGYFNSKVVVGIFLKLFKNEDYERLKYVLNKSNIKKENYVSENQYWHVVLTKLKELDPEQSLKKTHTLEELKTSEFSTEVFTRIIAGGEEEEEELQIGVAGGAEASPAPKSPSTAPPALVAASPTPKKTSKKISKEFLKKIKEKKEELEKKLLNLQKQELLFQKKKS